MYNRRNPSANSYFLLFSFVSLFALLSLPVFLFCRIMYNRRTPPLLFLPLLFFHHFLSSLLPFSWGGWEGLNCLNTPPLSSLSGSGILIPFIQSKTKHKRISPGTNRSPKFRGAKLHCMQNRNHVIPKVMVIPVQT